MFLKTKRIEGSRNVFDLLLFVFLLIFGYMSLKKFNLDIRGPQIGSFQIRKNILNNKSTLYVSSDLYTDVISLILLRIS